MKSKINKAIVAQLVRQEKQYRSLYAKREKTMAKIKGDRWPTMQALNAEMRIWEGFAQYNNVSEIEYINYRDQKLYPDDIKTLSLNQLRWGVCAFLSRIQLEWIQLHCREDIRHMLPTNND